MHRDERVCVIERINLRYLSELPQKVDLVTLNLSFISIPLVSFQTVVENLVFLCREEFFDWLLSTHPSPNSMGDLKYQVIVSCVFDCCKL